MPSCLFSDHFSCNKHWDKRQFNSISMEGGTWAAGMFTSVSFIVNLIYVLCGSSIWFIFGPFFCNSAVLFSLCKFYPKVEEIFLRNFSRHHQGNFNPKFEEIFFVEFFFCGIFPAISKEILTLSLRKYFLRKFFFVKFFLPSPKKF